MEWVYQNEGAKKDPRLYRSIFTVWETLWDETEVFRAQKGMYSALRNHPTVVQYDVSEEQLAWIVILLQVNRVLVENNRLPPENKKPFLVLVDDAQDMVKVNRDTRIAPFINYMNIGRENLCSIFLSFQTTHEINEQLLASAGTLILGRLPNGEEALRMTRILGLDRSYAHILQTLPSGQFLLRTPSSNGVFMLQTEMFDASFPTNLEQWEQENHRRIKDLYIYKPYPAASCERDQSKADSQVSPSAFRVLTEVFNHPFSILSDVQASLRFSSSSFDQAVRELEKRKWIRRVEFSRCKTLEILAGGYRAIGQTPPQYNGRFPHAFGVHWIEKKFQAEGWSTRREDTLPGSTHRIDLVAIKHPEIWAIEYETGASDILLNLTNCLETNAAKILFVLISDALHKKMRGEIRRSEKFSKVLADGRIILDTLWNYIQSDSQKNSK
jgi:DNA-binding MarR family transcriptional regulator